MREWVYGPGDELIPGNRVSDDRDTNALFRKEADRLNRCYLDDTFDTPHAYMPVDEFKEKYLDFFREWWKYRDNKNLYTHPKMRAWISYVGTAQGKCFLTPNDKSTEMLACVPGVMLSLSSNERIKTSYGPLKKLIDDINNPTNVIEHDPEQALYRLVNRYAASYVYNDLDYKDFVEDWEKLFKYFGIDINNDTEVESTKLANKEENKESIEYTTNKPNNSNTENADIYGGW